MLLLSMERRMGVAVFSSAWLISEYCVFWQLCFLVQSAHSRDLVNEHQRQTGEDPGAPLYTVLSLCAFKESMSSLFFPEAFL